MPWSEPPASSTDWAEGVHKSVNTGRPAKHREQFSDPAWSAAEGDYVQTNSADWTVSRGGVAGRLSRTPKSTEGGSSGAAVRADRHDVRVGGYVQTGDKANNTDAEATVGMHGVDARVSAKRTLSDGSTANGTAGVSMGNDGLTGRAGITRGHSHKSASSKTSATYGLSATGSADIRPSKPYADGDGWSVKYTMVVKQSALASAGLSNAGLDSQGTAGAATAHSVGGSLGGQAELTGKKRFATQAEAEAWYQTPVPDLSELAFLDPGSALNLEPGEERGGSVSLTGGVHGSTQAAGPTLSVGLTGQAGAGVRVERLTGSWVRVTRDLHAQGGAAGQIGAPGLDAGLQTTHGERGAQTWSLDLSTDAGRAAHTQILTGQTPALGPGVVRGDDVADSTDAQQLNTNVGPVGVAVGQRGTDRRITRPDGSTSITEDGRRTAQVTSHRMLVDYLPSLDEDRGMASRTEYSATGEELDTRAIGVGSADSSSAADNSDAIASAAGTATSGVPSGVAATPGKWDVSVDFGDDSVDRIIAAAEHFGSTNDPRHLQAPERRLIAAFRAAGNDRAAQRQAIQTFGRTDNNAAEAFRLMLHSKSGYAPQVDRYLGLEGSETWIGMAGHEEDERVLATASDDFADGDYSLHQKVRELLIKHQNRLLDLGNRDRYPEVPEPMRIEEIERTEQAIRKVEATLAMVPAAQRSGPAGDQDPTLTAAFEQAEQRRTALDAVFDTLDVHWDRHGIDHGSGGMHKTPYEQLGDQDWLLMTTDGPESERYREARRLREEGARLREEGADREASARRYLLKGEEDQAAAFVNDAIDRYDKATRLLADATRAVSAIESRHPEASWRQ